MQRSFADLGTPLSEVTFCVVDLETTGGSPTACEITEIGAIKLRGGECLGTLQTLVNPGVPIPPAITVLTGITDTMVVPAPMIDEVLPSFVEFARGSVIVGHNVRFDLGFLQAALSRAGRPRLECPVVDTCALARRLVRDEVPNCRLGTLAQQFRLPHKPTHRALDDALATGDLLHVLLERAGTIGVLGLDDLLSLPTIVGHPQAGKLRLTSRLPRTPGVYLFRDAGGRVLYVGKATNLRQRVRSYFSGDDRRKVGQLLRELTSIDHIPCRTPLEAAVLEVRLIHEHQPRYNRQAKRWRKYAYVKLTLDERFPRLAVARVPKGDGCVYLGPLPSHAFAKSVIDAIEAAAPIRRCTARVRGGCPPRRGPCAPAQLGVATCPCAGQVSGAEYGAIVERVRLGMTGEPALLLDPLTARMHALAAAERFEEAADARDRAAALATALRRQRRLDGLRRAGRMVVDVPGARAVLSAGRLVDVSDQSDDGHALLLDVGLTLADDAAVPLPRDIADEVACVAAWLDAHAHRVRLVSCDGELVSPLPKLPSFEPPRNRERR